MKMEQLMAADLKCRICLNVEELMVNIYDEVEDLNSNLSTLLEQCGDLKVDRSDVYPKYLCKECTSELLVAAKFREKCCKSKEMLQHYESQYLCSRDETRRMMVPVTDDEKILTYREQEKVTDECVLGKTELLCENGKGWEQDTDNLILEDCEDTSVPSEKTLIQVNYKAPPLDNAVLVFVEPNEQQSDNCNVLVTNIPATSKEKKSEPQFEQGEETISESGADYIVIDPYADLIEVDEESSCENYKVEHIEKSKVLTTNLRFLCDICGAAFAGAETLRRHIYLSHEPAVIYKCEHCSHSFTIKKKYTGHLVDCRNFRSKSLYVADATESTYKKQIGNPNIIGQLNKFLCKYCDKVCTSSFSLAIHLRSHTGDRPFKCDLCSKAFKTRSTLAGHMKRHRGVPDHICPYCNKTFYESTNLQAHVRTHTGEKPHECAVCGKRFTRVFLLQLHMRTHTGEKPYSCQFCDRSFAQLCDLKNHVQTHTGERRYHCPYCPKSFFKRRPLKVHMQRHSILEDSNDTLAKEHCNLFGVTNNETDIITNEVLDDCGLNLEFNLGK